MDIRFHNASAGDWSADCVLAFAFEKEEPKNFAPALWEAAPWLEIAPGLRDFRAKKDELALLYGHPESPVSRVLFCGLGSREKARMKTFRNAVAKAVTYCRDKGFATIALPAQVLDQLAEDSALFSKELLVREATVSALLSLYRLDAYRSSAEEKNGDKPADPRWFAFLFTEKHTPDAAHKAARQGEAEARGVIMARNFSNGPSNHITPVVLADEAEKLAKAHGFSCTVLNAEQIAQKGMGALYAVGKGSRNEPRFVILEHCPKGKEKDNPIVLVGKGITFDSGGISIKPAAAMHEMKGDMGGAAAVLGFFSTLGILADAEELPRIIGLIPLAENMPGGGSVKPGDVVTTLSGKTVEILNTDAEGRLILCDALTYAQQEWTPDALIDIATLTGACVIALGDYATGAFTDDAALRSAVVDAAEDTGDLLWPMPLWDDYDADLKSDVADVPNMAVRAGGAVYAALFLRRFIEKGTRWLHLDIAGPGYVTKASPLLPVPGGTGLGVRLFSRLIRDERISK